MRETGGASAYIVAARRTAVAPRGGALSHLQADELAAPVLGQLLQDACISSSDVDQVILGNALYAGGNPARLAALRAGLPQTVPAVTIDTQCCSGLDAIILGARLIDAGAAECVLAGGAESFSRAPIRMHRPLDDETEPVPYSRPAFAPPPYADQDLAEAAARLALENGVSRHDQAEFAVTSHKKALAAKDRLDQDLIALTEGTLGDGFTRSLTLRTAMRAPVVAGDTGSGLTAATIANEADGAAAVLLCSKRVWRKTGTHALKILAARSKGGDPADPALVPITVARALFGELDLIAADFDQIELMEAYAVQAMLTAERLGLSACQLNTWGGALARGHPIGSSGAVLAVHLFGQLRRTQRNADVSGAGRGLALIAAAGGLGSGLVVERVAFEGG